MTKGERTKSHILEQSALLFNKQGYAATSFGDIMTATNLEKGGIYNHFDNKEALMLESFKFAIGKVETRFRELITDRHTSLERLHAVLEVFRSFLFDPPIRGGCPMLNAAIEADDSLPVLRPVVRQALDSWRNTVRRILERGIADREIKRSVDAEAFSSVLIGALEGAVMLSKIYRDAVHIERMLDFLKTQLEAIQEHEPFSYAGG